MKRALYTLAIVATALVPISAGASPTLSPTLDKVLAPPPAGFTPVNLSGSPLKNGHFTVHEYAQTYALKAAEAERMLNQAGFVDGYDMAWYQQSTNHILLEYVLAFTGGRGARDILSYDQRTDTNEPQFQHAISANGIDPYFGIHASDTSRGSTAVLDAFSFVKGNDEIGVGLLSAKDDVLALAQSQVKAAYAVAPDATIPASEWPENATPSSAPAPAAAKSSISLAGIGIALLGGALVIGLIGAFLLLMVRRRGRTPAVVPAAAVPPPMAVQMSPDGRYWFDGRSWRDSAYEAPPYAQRSPDGAFWWDGASWRPAPQAVPQSSGR